MHSKSSLWWAKLIRPCNQHKYHGQNGKRCGAQERCKSHRSVDKPLGCKVECRNSETEPGHSKESLVGHVSREENTEHTRKAGPDGKRAAMNGRDCEIQGGAEMSLPATPALRTIGFDKQLIVERHGLCVTNENRQQASAGNDLRITEIKQKSIPRSASLSNGRDTH